MVCLDIWKVKYKLQRRLKKMLWFYSAYTYNYLFRPIPVYQRCTCVLAIKQIQNKTTYTPQNSNTQTEILYVLKRRFLWWYPPNNNSIQRHQSRCQEINYNFLTIACSTRISQCSSKKKNSYQSLNHMQKYHDRNFATN